MTLRLRNTGTFTGTSLFSINVYNLDTTNNLTVTQTNFTGTDATSYALWGGSPLMLIGSRTQGGVGQVAVSTPYAFDNTVAFTVSGNTYIYGRLSAGGVDSSTGFYATSSFNGTYTDGIVVDYVTGNGRVSVGAGDNISFYNGGPANTALMTLSSTGNVAVNATPASMQTLTVGGSATFYGGISASNIVVNGKSLTSGTQALVAGYSIVFGR